ncbi:MAG: PDGLE domain-containing protein [Candidatus Methanofastidiosia archaeon]
MKWWYYSLVICIVIGGVISLFASGSPDGLERVAEDKGFAEEAEESTFEIMPDYTVPLAGSDVASASLAGIVGVLIIFLAVYGIGKVFRRAE